MDRINSNYTFDVDTIDYIVTEYAGNVETCYTRTDTITQRIHNSIGYYTDSTYYHYIKDYLGNVCAVVHSTADTLIQSTLYYASGVPMAQSWGRDKQPYLYNGKEFVEAHGLNTYDYGFRGYYAPIGRFTAIDPLAEQTPWQSPYSYAGNRFVNAIDWMGLGGITGFSHSPDICQYIVIDPGGNYQGGVDDDDNSIYIAEGGWKPENGKEGLERVGRMLFPFWVYENLIGKGNKAPGLYYGQYSITISGNIGLDVFIPTPIGELGVNILSYEIINKSINGNGDTSIDYFAKDGEARISTLQFSLGLLKTKYSIKHELLGEMRYVPNTNTSSISVGIFSIDVNGSFSMTYSLGLILVGSISITGNAYYGQD